jgi:hypothetical protein
MALSYLRKVYKAYAQMIIFSRLFNHTYAGLKAIFRGKTFYRNKT